jgi:hypothetical protein
MPILAPLRLVQRPIKATGALLLLLVYVNGFHLSFHTVRHFELAFLSHQQAGELNDQRIVRRVARK